MGHKIICDPPEPRRTVHFVDGQRMDFHKVVAWDCSGEWLRLWCEEGFVLLHPAKINAHVIKPDPRPGNEENDT